MEKAKRKEREYSFRRAAILEQAVKIFASKGFHNTTMVEIARASGFAVGSIYLLFDSKEQLYTEMLTEKLNMLYSGTRKLVSKEAEVDKKVEMMVMSQFHFVEENAEFCSIFIRGDHLSLSRGSIELRKRMMADYAAHISFVEAVMSEGIRTGFLKAMDPRMMAAALAGLINSCASKWLTMEEKASLMNYIPFVVDIFLQGVRKDAHQ
jgi:AcrR family transcriptional regulator